MCHGMITKKPFWRVRGICGRVSRTLIWCLGEWIFPATSCDFPSKLLINSKLIIYRNPSMGYDVTPLQACLMYANLSELVTKTTVWPHPEDLFMGGSKVQCYETLRIASLSMGVPTPFYVILGEKISDPTFVKDFAEGRVQGVLKRDYSMKSQHVIFPTTPNTASTIQNALNEEKKTWNTVEELFGRPQWFLQPTVAHLLHVGEVRCFIVGGRLVYKVTTTPIKGGGVHVTNHEPTRPLHTHS